jgi:hypothetical protein
MATSYQLPTPKKRNERRAFTARDAAGNERVWHATAKTNLFKNVVWEVDVEDWFVFGAGWVTVGEAEIVHPEQRTNPGRS